MTLYTPYPNLLLRNGLHNRAVHVVGVGGGKFRMVYQRSGLGGESDSPTIRMRDSDDGRNWNNDRLIVDETGSHDTLGPCLLYDSGGMLWLTYNRTTTGETPAREGVFYRTSDDKGETWSSATQITTTGYSNAATGGPMVELANGDLIQPFWDAAGGNFDAALSRSTDGGDSWGSIVVIGDGSADSLDYKEPNIIQMDNGDLLCTIRETSTDVIYSATSDDDGETWTAPASAITTASGAPRLYQISDNTVIVLYRDTAGVGGHAEIRTSVNRGGAWSAGKELLADGHLMTYGGMIELSGSRVGIGFGARWSVDGGTRGDLIYKIMDFTDLP